MFDIAWSEMVLIGAVALVVIGPKDLPKVLRTVGQTVGKVRRMATEFQGQFNEAMREAELADLKKQVEDVGGSVSNSFNSDYKPIEQPKEFAAPSTAETAKAAEEKLKEAEAKLAALPTPDLPPLDIAAETPTPAAGPLPATKAKRARKPKDDAPGLPAPAEPAGAVAASTDNLPTPKPVPARRARAAGAAPTAGDAAPPVKSAASKGATKAGASAKPARAARKTAPVAPAPVTAATRKPRATKGGENSA